MTEKPHRDPHGLGPLLQRSLAGDALALNSLLTRLRPYLHALVRRRLGPDARGRLDHSSVVQKAMLRVSQHVGGLRDPTVPRLLNWVGRIVHNLIADGFRAKGNEPAAVGGSHAFDAAGKELTPQAQAERDERAIQVAAALEHLPEKQRQVVELRFFDRLPDAEICRRVGGSQEAVRILRFRALRRLRDLMAGLAPEGGPTEEATDDA